MNKVNSIDALRQIKEQAKQITDLRTEISPENSPTNHYKKHVLVCGGTGCVSSGCGETRNALIKALADNDLTEEIMVVTTGCFGFCEQGPIVKIYPENAFYVQVDPNGAKEIVEQHIKQGEPVKRLMFSDPNTGKKIAEHHDLPFYQAQVRIALKNCGIIDPEKITEYIAVDGYAALAKCLTEMTQQEVIDLMKASNLRGRGGAGFPTGLKWEFAYKNESDKKYVVCNADEGDPGAFMDRSILEGDPNGILEAMAIAGYAIGADEGVIYIRAEYPLAVERLEIAIEQAKVFGLLGNNILGTNFNFNISINLGAGAFVCGEETALLNSIQGLRGEPRVKPPFPAQKGLWNKPTIINNVETLANVCQIILNGADWFKQVGTPKSPGTKVFALAGKINNVGLVEVPMGIKVRDIIYNIGGGIRNGKKFKALQTGGPSGGCISSENLDLPVDYETLQSIGSMMGSGGMIVLDEDDCMVNIAKFYLEFTVEESCGKCTPCRIGNTRLLEILERITIGQGTMEDLTTLKELGQTIKDCSLCGLGQTAPNPILSTIRYFYDEYEAHVLHKKCPAGACKDLLSYKIVDEKCIGCTICARNCPVNCISGERKQPHNINQEKCIKCGVCFTKCPTKAIVKE